MDQDTQLKVKIFYPGLKPDDLIWFLEGKFKKKFAADNGMFRFQNVTHF